MSRFRGALNLRRETADSPPVPLTFFAHQAPFLPIARRWPRHVDGLALVVGTMAPDFAYVLAGTPLHVWAHELPGLVAFCLPATLVVSWLIARVLARPVAAHLPELGAFRLQDYRGLAAHRFHPVRTVVWAVLGAFGHSALDSLGHSWGWPVRTFPWMQTVVLDGTFLDRPWKLYRVLQWTGHLGLTPLAIWMLYRYGQARWFAASAALVEPFHADRGSHLRLWSSAAIGFAATAAWSLLAPQDTSATILRLAGGGFVGLVLGALLVRRREERALEVPAELERT